MRVLIFFFLVPTLLFAQEKKVGRVFDGNTFETSNGEKIRIIGINAPELNAVFGMQSKKHLQQLIGDKLVVLQGDIMSPKQDASNLMLRYVSFK